MKLTQNEVTSSLGNSIPYTYVQTNLENNKLCIMLPGLGYTTDQPLFYYATGLFLEKDYDILHINYKYESQKFMELEQEKRIEIVSEDVKASLDQLLPERKYEDIYIMAKSIGTAALVNELENRKEIRNAKIVWLTPLLQVDNVFNYLYNSNQHEGLLIIGDKDRCYVEERFNSLTAKEDLKVKLMKDTNHALEHVEGMYMSIDCLKEILAEIDRFILV